ncbi:uncharacterized protein C7orf50 [Polyodon spathula]|uniref:uncharacterized protein C7orf50 n=1 Tax=Polyodon spathula TaxID=7913 RepID=UPI001B7E66A3|nr:uncharacterized protein C7orf50 [Polyodon spathula]
METVCEPRNNSLFLQYAEKQRLQHELQIQPDPEEVLPEVQGEEEEEEDEEDEEGLTLEERMILEQKIKKERKKEEKQQMKEAGVSAQVSVKPSRLEMAQDYLTCWSKNHKDWRFQKMRRTWLLQHMCDSDKVPDEFFAVLLEYLDGLKDGARKTTVKKAESLIEGCEDWEDSATLVKAGRAREIIQLFS